MFKKIIVASILAVAVVGCGSSSSDSNDVKISPKTKQPTGDFDKLQIFIDSIENNDSDLNSIIDLIQKTSKIQNDDIGFKADRLEVADKKRSFTTNGVTNEARPDCITDATTSTQDKTSATAKGTVDFNNCTIKGVNLDGSIYADYVLNKENNTSISNYRINLTNFKLSDSDSSIYINKANSKVTITDSHNDEAGRGNAIVEIGISGYAMHNDKKIMILDGLYIKSESKWNKTNEESNTTYKTTVNGYIGNYDMGMFKISTKNKIVNGNKACPESGELEIVSKDKKANITFSGDSYTLNGKEYSCTK